MTSTSLLGYAAGPDTSDSNLVIEVIALVIIAATCILAAIPIVTSRRRRLEKTEGIAALMVIWGLVSAGSAIYIANAHTLRETRFFDPTNQSGPPIPPWIWLLWAALLVMYAGALIWSFAAKPYVPPPPRAGFEVIPPAPPSKG